MGSRHRRRLGLRMGFVGPLASRARAEVDPKEDGSDDQTDSVDGHCGPATACGTRPADAGTRYRGSLPDRVEQPAGQTHVPEPDERQRSRCRWEHDLRNLLVRARGVHGERRGGPRGHAGGSPLRHVQRPRNRPRRPRLIRQHGRHCPPVASSPRDPGRPIRGPPRDLAGRVSGGDRGRAPGPLAAVPSPAAPRGLKTFSASSLRVWDRYLWGGSLRLAACTVGGCGPKRLGGNRMERAIVLLSGGVDSAVALWWAKKQGWDIRPLTFDYFGRPKRENGAVRALTSQAETAPIRHVDLPFLKEVDDLRKEGFENRILLDSPEGYIPGRNLIFYGLAGYYAELDAARYLVGGHNGVDPESFPDSSPKFFNFLNSMFHLSLWSYDKAPVQILVPLSGKSKEEVVRMGLEMNVPFDVTWSCYWDRAVHCGTCVSCRERKEAFSAVGVEDPVEYAT
ncbi:MAG: 7-cyano-7-deazaguanine synthase [Methanobacteriota archaeon]|nr:MAG: 7-cyano-7-deazaguanine synthase [Euryarchaeota archaeon]